MIRSKICTKCDEDKPLADFGVRASRADGRHYQCKVCNALNVKAWRRRNHAKDKAVSAAWSRANPARKRMNAASTQKKKQTPPWLTADQRNQMVSVYEHATDCQACTGEPYHVDHIVPVNGKHVSGLHVPWNLQVLPADVNMRKHAAFNDWS